MRTHLLATLAIGLTCTASFASECPEVVSRNTAEAAITQFFANYEIIGANGFPAFIAEQTKLLSTELVTEVRDPIGTHAYEGTDGYFQSLGDWSKYFATGEDFSTEYAGLDETDCKYVMKLHGTLSYTRDGLTRKYAGERNRWQERFVLDRDGKITHLDVNMGIPTGL